MLLITFSNMK